MHKLKSENEVEALKFGLINEKKTKEEKGILCREDGEQRNKELYEPLQYLGVVEKLKRKPAKFVIL